MLLYPRFPCTTCDPLSLPHQAVRQSPTIYPISSNQFYARLAPKPTLPQVELDQIGAPHMLLEISCLHAVKR